MFGAHVMSSVHEPSAVQSITQTPSWQVPFVQPCAHRSSASGRVSVVLVGPSTRTGALQAPRSGLEQYPATQDCPSAQSVTASQVTVQSDSFGS